MATIEQVLHAVTEATRSGRAHWRTGSTDGHLMAVLGEYTLVVIGREGLRRERALQVIDSRGEILDEIREESLEHESEDWRELKSLQEMARRQALGVESQLDVLLLEISGRGGVRLVGRDAGEMTIQTEVWQPVQSLMEHLEPEVSARLAPWKPGTLADRHDADRLRKAIEWTRKDRGRLNRMLEEIGFERRTTQEGTVHQMGAFRLPAREIERLEEFLRRSGGFIIQAIQAIQDSRQGVPGSQQEEGE